MSIPASALRPTTIPTTNKSTKPIAKEKPDSEDDENTTSDKKNNNDYDPEDNPIKNAQNMAEGLKSNVETSKGASKLIKPAKVIAVVEELNPNPVDIGISFNPINDKKVILPSKVQEKLYSGSQSLEKPLVFPKNKKKSAVTKVFEDLEANEKLFKQAKVDKKTGFVSEIGLLSKLNKGIGGLGVITGTLEVGQGVKEVGRGERYEGGFKIVEGAVGVIGGGALATGAVIGGVAVAPIAAGVGVALYVGHAGNNRTKELGLFKNSKGENRSAIHYVGDIANETNKKVTKKTVSRIAGAVAAHTAANLQIGIGTVAILGAGTAQVIRDGGNMVIDGIKLGGKATKGAGKATVKFIGKVGNSIAKVTKITGNKLQKVGESANKFANKIDKKASQLKNSKHLLAKTFGYDGAVGLAKASHFIGNKTKHLGRQINTLGNDIKTNTGKFVSSAKIEGKKLISSVRTTGHNIKNQARRLTTAIDTATTGFVHSAQKYANTITNFVGSTTGNIVHGTKQNIHVAQKVFSNNVGVIRGGLSNTWHSIFH